MASDKDHPAVIGPAEREALIKLAIEINAKAGIVHDPTATTEEVQEMMRAAGIRPEDSILSRDIIRAKYPDDEEEEAAMADRKAAAPPVRFAKEALIKIADEIDAKAGIVYDPTATAQKAREMMLAEGIRPEDNLFSRDIIRTKYPDDCKDVD